MSGRKYSKKPIPEIRVGAPNIVECELVPNVASSGSRPVDKAAQASSESGAYNWHSSSRIRSGALNERAKWRSRQKISQNALRRSSRTSDMVKPVREASQDLQPHEVV